MKTKKEKPDIMKVVSTAIVNSRIIIFGLFIAAAIYCAMSIGKVKVNSDITAFLPDTTETRQGLTIMDEEFITYGTADIMISNITSEQGQRLADKIVDMPHVTDVTYDNTPAHYAEASALISVSFDGTALDETIISAFDDIKKELDGYDIYISSDVGDDFSAQLAKQMAGVVVIVLIVVAIVLLLTSRSYFEVIVYFIVFGFAALLNMGTNFWMGEISSITNSVAVVLQLALAIDYSIIFCHRYQDEAAENPNEREALIKALSEAIIEISSSSLTTVSGMIVLTLMQFGLGRDLGLILAKGILCSLLTVFLLMPGLIYVFRKLIRKTAHKKLIPSVLIWGKFLMKSKGVFIIIFMVVLPIAFYGSNTLEYAFADDTITELVYDENRAAMHKITDTFDLDTTIALLVPSGDFESEKHILSDVANYENVKEVTGLANIEIEEGHVLTDVYTPRMLSELLDIDIEEAVLLIQAYGVEHEQYQPVFGNVDDYDVPLVDLLLYLFEKLDQGVISLNDEKMQTITDLRESLNRGLDQLRGENWDRLVIVGTVPVEGEESLALVDKIRTEAEKYYGEGSVFVIGDITSARDLRDSYNSDSLKINLLTITFVFIILLFTFKTFVGSLLLVFVIQGSIWINFACTKFVGQYTSFVTYMIVSALQMGATIDYAIVIMNRYLSLRTESDKKSAMAVAVDQSFTTVFTSGTILTTAGFLIAGRISDVYVSHIGLAIGRGSLISIILVLTVLPQLIVLLDKAIDKTRFTIKLMPEEEEVYEKGSTNCGSVADSAAGAEYGSGQRDSGYEGKEGEG